MNIWTSNSDTAETSAAGDGDGSMMDAFMSSTASWPPSSQQPTYALTHTADQSKASTTGSSAAAAQIFNQETRETLQQRLHDLMEGARESWTYAIFWQSSAVDYSGSFVVEWGDGYYKGEENKIKCKTASSPSEQEHRKKVLRELNFLIYHRPRVDRLRRRRRGGDRHRVVLPHINDAVIRQRVGPPGPDPVYLEAGLGDRPGAARRLPLRSRAPDPGLHTLLERRRRARFHGADLPELRSDEQGPGPLQFQRDGGRFGSLDTSTEPDPSAPRPPSL